MNNFDYQSCPDTIERESFRQIRTLTGLTGLSSEQQQVVMRIVHTTGSPEIAQHVRFSDEACIKGMRALAQGRAILCDVEMVQRGLSQSMLKQQPLCFINHEATRLMAQKSKETRAMASVRQWPEHLRDSVVIIGNAPTALFRLLEVLQRQPEIRPALLIAMPVGFIGAAEAKQALWELHRSLAIECITLLGRQGGSAVAAASCNALLRCNRGIYF